MLVLDVGEYRASAIKFQQLVGILAVSTAIGTLIMVVLS